MDCNKANDFIMMHMDNNLPEKSFVLLKQHIEICQTCRRDFELYDGMMKEFSVAGVLYASECPKDGFEAVVMSKISDLPSAVVYAVPSADNSLCAVVGTFSIASGIAFISYLNSAEIINYCSSSPYLAGYTPYLERATVIVQSFLLNTGNLFNSISTSVVAFLTDYKYYALILLAILAVIQMFVLKPKRAGV